MKKIFLIITLASFVLISGCKATNTETAEFSSQISSLVSGSHITEFETESNTAQEGSSELSATVAQGYETVSEVNSKPAAQSQETKTESSAAKIKLSVAKSNNLSQPSVENEIDNSDSTLSDGSGNAIKNATAADTREVADMVIFYLNKARAGIGGGHEPCAFSGEVPRIVRTFPRSVHCPHVCAAVTLRKKDERETEYIYYGCGIGTAFRSGACDRGETACRRRDAEPRCMACVGGMAYARRHRLSRAGLSASPAPLGMV